MPDLFKPCNVGICRVPARWTMSVFHLAGRSRPTSAVGIGGDPSRAPSYRYISELFWRTRNQVVIMIGAIGWIGRRRTPRSPEGRIPSVGRKSPMVPDLSSCRTAPPGRRMGHAGARLRWQRRLRFQDRGEWNLPEITVSPSRHVRNDAYGKNIAGLIQSLGFFSAANFCPQSGKSCGNHTMACRLSDDFVPIFRQLKDQERTMSRQDATPSFALTSFPTVPRQLHRRHVCAVLKDPLVGRFGWPSFSRAKDAPADVQRTHRAKLVKGNWPARRATI